MWGSASLATPQGQARPSTMRSPASIYTPRVPNNHSTIRGQVITTTRRGSVSPRTVQFPVVTPTHKSPINLPTLTIPENSPTLRAPNSSKTILGQDSPTIRIPLTSQVSVDNLILRGPASTSRVPVETQIPRGPISTPTERAQVKPATKLGQDSPTTLHPASISTLRRQATAPPSRKPASNSDLCAPVSSLVTRTLGTRAPNTIPKMHCSTVAGSSTNNTIKTVSSIETKQTKVRGNRLFYRFIFIWYRFFH